MTPKRKRSAPQRSRCASLLLGWLDEATSFGNRALKYSPAHPGSAAHALHLLGDIAAHPHRFDVERGEAHYRRALALAEPRGMRPLVAHCHLGLGKLYRRRSRLLPKSERTDDDDKPTITNHCGQRLGMAGVSAGD